jgi:hypothetical protein
MSELIYIGKWIVGFVLLLAAIGWSNTLPDESCPPQPCVCQP